MHDIKAEGPTKKILLGRPTNMNVIGGYKWFRTYVHSSSEYPYTVEYV